MANCKAGLYQQLQQVCETNRFAALLGMEVAKLGEKEATLIIPVISEKHTNYDGFIHGGVLSTMADMAMGVACATIGKRIWTIEMNTNFIKNVTKGQITAVGKVIHDGKITMVAEAEIWDEEQNLLVKGRGTFYVCGYFEESNL